MKTLALAALLAAVAASAEEGRGNVDPMRQACGADAERLCPGSPDPGACLHEHWDEVSQGCKDFKQGLKKQWENKHKAADPMRRACGADVDRLCPGSKMPGQCLHEHWNEVSPGCKSFKEGMRKQWEQKSKSEGKDGKGKHVWFGGGDKPAATPKGRMKFEWTKGEPKPEPPQAPVGD